MTTRPNLVIANFEGVRLFDDTDLALLGSVGDVLDPEPLGRWDDPRADDLLSRADVIVGHWGCPPIDAALLDRAPRLGLIAYAGGTVRETIAPEVLGRVRVTSCADANAECGALADGCGGILDCGQCPAGLACGGSGIANRCGAPG